MTMNGCWIQFYAANYWHLPVLRDVQLFCKLQMSKIKRNKNNEETIQKALNEIRNGEPKKRVAQKYGIPRSTLQFRLGPRFSKIRPGPKTYLTEEEENLLEKWLIESHQKGFPRRKIDLQVSVKNFMDADGRPNPFKNNTPGKNPISIIKYSLIHKLII